MRVVVFQGQYGVFKREDLDLSMPAVQTCLGLYALSDQHDYLLCAHFDTGLRLQQNLEDIQCALTRKAITMKSMHSVVFGGDGKQSYLRCSKPSSDIGHAIVNFIKARGGTAEYSSQYYSGIIPQTFNFYYKRRYGITEGENCRDFMGAHPQARNIARQRIKLTPREYSPAQAKMTDISNLYY
ncbi:hypothetical protein SAMN05192562_1011194 [Kosakonia arachidis]|uniref:Uncharacterized protein n=1 Tax=Kosakonia arachidis TaxID=551989 RepID=A0A1I6ZJ15_9ENTR|nr:hypothetical protein [Kosakonia arachidis]SFT62633.1 hypothetical protein SAMN05192562_1011194 [Kosakonia arachidis]